MKRIYEGQLVPEFSRLAAEAFGANPFVTLIANYGVLLRVDIPSPLWEQEKDLPDDQRRKLLEQQFSAKQEAERESRGDFSQAPGMTPDQREAAAIKWAEKDATACISGAKPAPW